MYRTKRFMGECFNLMLSTPYLRLKSNPNGLLFLLMYIILSIKSMNNYKYEKLYVFEMFWISFNNNLFNLFKIYYN